MANDQMMAQMSTKPGFIAALDQSGGSTPGALRLYGIPDSDYKGDDAKMFELVHEMRVRMISSPAFNGDKVIAAILFERTMDGEAKGKPVPSYLWEDRGVVPILKVDKGLEAEKDGVSLMKPMPDLDPLLARAVKLGVFGTKMRSTSIWRRKPASRRSPSSNSSSASRSPPTGCCRFSNRKSRSRARTRRSRGGSCSTN